MVTLPNRPDRRPRVTVVNAVSYSGCGVIKLGKAVGSSGCAFVVLSTLDFDFTGCLDVGWVEDEDRGEPAGVLFAPSEWSTGECTKCRTEA